MLDDMLWDCVYQHLTPLATCVWVGGREEPRALWSKIIVVDVDDGDGFVRKEVVGSFVKHTGGVIAEDGLRLDMKIRHHGVAVPPAHHLDIAEIHLAMEQCHGPACTQG
jgi:hypothetical protein